MREGEPVERRLVIFTQSGKGRQVVAALEHVDRVELKHAEALHEEVQLAGADGCGRATESLGGERNASGLGGGKGLDHRLRL